MKKFKYTKKYIIPILCTVILVVLFILGVTVIRSDMKQQTINERTYQLENMLSQVRVNLEYGLNTHWNLVSSMENCVKGVTYSDNEEMENEIKSLEDTFSLSDYGCGLMFIDSTGNILLSTGSAGIWDDIGRLSDGDERHTFVSETSNFVGTYIAFVKKLEEPATTQEGTTVTHIAMLKDVNTLKEYYATKIYSGNATTYIIKENGTLAYYDGKDEVLRVRNIFKLLENKEIEQGHDFDKIMKRYNNTGTAASYIEIDDTEYYYCLASLEKYDMTLMMLIPSEYVAASTIKLMNSSIKLFVVYAFIMVIFLSLLIKSIIAIQRGNKIVEMEQENNRKLNELKIAAEDALDLAEAASRSKSTFLSNMSHDIRTPMNAVIGFATLGMANADDPEKVRAYMSKILSSSNHLLSLINDILDMSRIESGKIVLEETEANLSDMLHDIKTIVDGQIHAKQLELFMDVIDVTNEDVYCDRTRLNQVFLNLISNAIKFTPAGGIISMRIAQLHNSVEGMGTYEIRVKDTGIGMSPEFAEKIFEPFEREFNTTVNQIQGTGLGMSIAKNIIDMMGGTIEVRTERGKGTEFIVRLELRLQTEHREVMQIKELEGLKALVVDDDFNTCDSVTKMLVKVGMRSEWTLSGKEAVLRAKQSIEINDAFHAYIIDWRLPDMNGIEVTRQIRSLGDDTPIIILTAYDWNDIEEEAKAAGVTAFCSKPMFMSDLRDALLTALGQQSEEKEQNMLRVDEKNGFKDKHMLIVEDNELNREIATEILGRHGFIIDTAENGVVALEKVSSSQPGEYDIILMDIQMPLMDGYEATRRIRNLDNKELASIPILAMTANAFNEDRKAAEECGMDGFLSKPIDIEETIRTLNDILL